MSIELTDKTIGIWAVWLTDDSDWLCSAWVEDDNYVIAYRFRYYVDDKTFDSDDRKSWYRYQIPVQSGGEQKVAVICRTVAESLWRASGGKRYEIMMASGGIMELMAALEKWPMISMKKVGAEDLQHEQDA